MAITRREAMAHGGRCQWGFGEIRPKSFDISRELVCGHRTRFGDCYCVDHRAGMASDRHTRPLHLVPHSR